MESLLQGRLRNTHLPASRAMIPLYEAVVNSIHAIEEDAERTSRSISEYKLEIGILRQQTLLSGQDAKSEDPIDGFLIRDDGIGFNSANWASFNTLDSIYKEAKGSRGIGRLMWLKGFRDVEIDSVFVGDQGQLLRRRFVFDPKLDVVSEGNPVVTSGPRETLVRLRGFLKPYSEHCPKGARVVASGILEHCLWYFVRAEGIPAIRVIDGVDVIDLSELFDEHMHSDARAETVEIQGETFEVTHVKFRANLNKANVLNYCAAGRQVKSESLKGQVPGLTSTMSDAHGTFTYAAYLTGNYLDRRVNEQRTEFNIDEESDGLLKGVEVSFREIRSAVIPRVKSFLSESLLKNIEASKDRVDAFVRVKAPRYRTILPHVDAEEIIVDPSISDRDLDLLLHKQLYKIEEGILREGHDIAVPLKGESEAAYRQRLEEYLQTVSDLKQSDLANYVTHRRIILDLLEAAIYRDEDGGFSREDTIHELIVPMRRTSEDYEFRREDLWLIDERLTFHDYLASDKPFATMPISSDKSGKEPDAVALRVFNTPLLIAEKEAPPASLIVLEIKRPMRANYIAGKDEKSDPILQSLDYLSRLRNGTATRRGRPIPNASQIPGFVYIVADLTDELVRSCELFNLTRTFDGMGYFGYHPKPAFNAYIQVMSFDGLLKGAKERNRAFFDKLGLPAH